MSEIPVRGLLAGMLGFMSLAVGHAYVKNGGLGVRETRVEYVFREEGRKMAVMNEEFLGWGHNRYVACLREDCGIERGNRLLYLNPKVLSYRTWNYEGISDNGERIVANQEGFCVSR